MDKISGAFLHGDLKKVLYGPGSISGIAAELDARGARCVGVFDAIAEHVQAPGVYALVEEIQRTDADALVAFGGGSPIDGAKAAVASLMAGRDLLAETSTNFYRATAVEKVGKH